jgi:DNA-binding MarR family transcriptional regulator
VIARDISRLRRLYIKVLAQELPSPHTEYMAEAMLYLASRDGKSGQIEMAGRLEVDKRSILPMLGDLEKLSYILIESAPKRPKLKIFTLTAYGRSFIPAITAAIERTNMVFKGQMTEPDHSAWLYSLDRMEQTLLRRVTVIMYKKHNNIH